MSYIICSSIKFKHITTLNLIFFGNEKHCLCFICNLVFEFASTFLIFTNFYFYLLPHSLMEMMFCSLTKSNKNNYFEFNQITPWLKKITRTQITMELKTLIQFGDTLILSKNSKMGCVHTPFRSDVWKLGGGPRHEEIPNAEQAALIVDAIDVEPSIRIAFKAKLVFGAFVDQVDLIVEWESASKRW